MSDKMRVEYWDIDRPIPYENNPRDNDKAVEKVANSIQEFGFQQPLVVDAGGVIIVGHTRLKAAQLLGLEQVPVVVAKNLTPAQAQMYRLADNKVAEFSTWDFEKLDVELEGLEVDFDMGEFGFDAPHTGFGEPDETDDVGGETSFNYKEQYGVIVMCSDEADQERVYNRLTDEGYTCKVVAV